MAGFFHQDAVSRRAVIQAGMTGVFGISLPTVLRLRQATASQRNTDRHQTSVIFLELAGGPTQHETYDPKPDAPLEYRGSMSPIRTALPGVQFCEVMQQQARIVDKLAVLRAVTHDSGSHGTSSHFTQTGYYLRDSQNRENEMPCIGAYTAKVRGANAQGIPGFVAIPSSMRFGRSAWLGKSYNPFDTVRSADTTDFKVPNLTLLNGLTNERLMDRKALLQGFDASRRIADVQGVAAATDKFTREAFDMVTGGSAQRAFDISAESQPIREKYGMNSLGQNLLLARRLVEHGVTFVSVRCNTLGSWDDHTGIAERMRAKGPGFDQGVAALVSDLHDRGLADDVLVIAMGEFGRTPRLNKNAGRDHWGQVMSVMLACGGLKTGQIIGSTDSNGAVAKDQPYRPSHVLAMAYRHLGIDPALTFTDPSGRPRYLLEEQALIPELF